MCASVDYLGELIKPDYNACLVLGIYKRVGINTIKHSEFCGTLIGYFILVICVLEWFNNNPNLLLDLLF